MKKYVMVLLTAFILCLIPTVINAENTKTGLNEIRITLADGLKLSTINAGSKDVKYENNYLKLVDSSGNESEFEEIEIKGRGNFTWTESSILKKGYQIKFSKKEDVFGLGKAKKWVLLANYTDASLMRNKLAFDLAKAIGMPYTSDSIWIDLYVNDEYLGNYLLCEKNEVGSNRVALVDDYGVLCEIDNTYGTSEEIYYRTPLKKTTIVLSDSKADDIEAENSKSLEAFNIMCEKIANLEALLYNDNSLWDDIEKLIDVDSFIKYYFLQELVEDLDGCRSSFFLWSDGKDDKIHLGPVWDFDSSMGAYITKETGGDISNDYTYNIENYIVDLTGSKSVGWFKRLFNYRQFDSRSVEVYQDVIKPVFNNISSMIDNYLSDGTLIASANANFKKWTNILGKASIFKNRGHRYSSTYTGEIDYLKNWLNSRVDYLNSRYDTSPVFYKHVHNLTLIKGKEASDDSLGYKDYYACSDKNCGMLFEDEKANIVIDDLQEWKNDRGKLVKENEVSLSNSELTFKLNGKNLGKFVFKQEKNGWSIKNEKGYLSISSSSLKYSSSPFVWSYNDGHFSAKVKTTTLLFFSKETTYYLTVSSANELIISKTNKGNASFFADKAIVHEHKLESIVKENIVDATCLEDGSYDEVGYCSCGEELSRERKVVKAIGHQALNPIEEIIGDKKYSVTYCSKCHEMFEMQEIIGKIDVNVQINKQSKRFLIFFTRTSYEVKMSAKSTITNVGIKTIKYSTNGSNWISASSFTSSSKPATFYIQVIDTNNVIHNYIYRNENVYEN